MNTMQSATTTITNEYRAAKAHLETVLGTDKAIGLDAWLRSMVVEPTVVACEIKRFYSMRGADVADSAVKTLAYARMAQAWTAFAAI